MEINSIGDVAVELNRRYSKFLNEKKEFKKGEKSQTFLEILKDLFSKYGQRLGYNDFSSFKSIIRQCQINLKKGKQVIINNYNDFKKVVEEIDYFPKQNYKEGDGEIHSIELAELYGLDPLF